MGDSSLEKGEGVREGVIDALDVEDVREGVINGVPDVLADEGEPDVLDDEGVREGVLNALWYALASSITFFFDSSNAFRQISNCFSLSLCSFSSFFNNHAIHCCRHSLNPDFDFGANIVGLPVTDRSVAEFIE
jgi:hypothetical protein